jgi:hypothetical protein
MKKFNGRQAQSARRRTRSPPAGAAQRRFLLPLSKRLCREVEERRKREEAEKLIHDIQDEIPPEKPKPPVYRLAIIAVAGPNLAAAQQQPMPQGELPMPPMKTETAPKTRVRHTERPRIQAQAARLQPIIEEAKPEQPIDRVPRGQIPEFVTNVMAYIGVEVRESDLTQRKLVERFGRARKESA